VGLGPVYRVGGYSKSWSMSNSAHRRNAETRVAVRLAYSELDTSCEIDCLRSSITGRDWIQVLYFIWRSFTLVLSGHNQSVFGPAVSLLSSRYHYHSPLPIARPRCRDGVAWQNSICGHPLAVVVCRAVIINRGFNNYQTARSTSNRIRLAGRCVSSLSELLSSLHLRCSAPRRAAHWRHPPATYHSNTSCRSARIASAL